MTGTGISGDSYYGFETGLESLVDQAWITKNVQVGPLGAHYPNLSYIMEGDSSSFLGLVPNGLNIADSPSSGGWGGRYAKTIDPDSNVWTDTTDWYTSPAGVLYKSSQASIWCEIIPSPPCPPALR